MTANEKSILYRAILFLMEKDKGTAKDILDDFIKNSEDVIDNININDVLNVLKKHKYALKENGHGIWTMSQQARKKLEREEMWCNYCKRSLENLYGYKQYVKLSEIYKEVSRLRDADDAKEIVNLGATVRGTLQNNSRGMGRDIFEPKYIGSGYWKLKIKNRNIF